MKYMKHEEMIKYILLCILYCCMWQDDCAEYRGFSHSHRGVVVGGYMSWSPTSRGGVRGGGGVIHQAPQLSSPMKDYCRLLLPSSASRKLLTLTASITLCNNNRKNNNHSILLLFDIRSQGICTIYNDLSTALK